MNPELLESLLLDDALGSTSPEVHALLEAHLAANPSAKARQEQWRQLANLATQCLTPPTAGLPEFPRQRILAANQSRQSIRRIASIAALAACLLVGFFLGIGSQLLTTHSNDTAQQVQRPANDPPQGERRVVDAPAAPVESTEPVHGFWSVRRWQAYLSQNNSPPERHVSWESPLRQPRIGGVP